MVDYSTPSTTPHVVGSSLLPSPDPTHYRQVLSHFATGITIITANHCDTPVGFTANSFCSVSLEPSLVSFCASNTSVAWPLIQAAGKFCVNVLSEDQKDLCIVFARKGVDRFAKTRYSLSPAGTPVLAGVLAWIECSIVEVFPAGDHAIVLGLVHRLEHTTEGNPLVWSQGKFGTFAGE